MTDNPLALSLHILLVLLWQCTGSWTIYSGSWCPYQVEKMVPCRVRNGTEAYYGPNICWKSINGSFACTKKILHRPKFITTYKKIVETKYKCCPGLKGSDCQDECFNCTSFHEMADRVAKIEMKLVDIEDQEDEARENELLVSQTFLDEDVLHQRNILHGERHEKSLIFIALNTRISSLIHEFRDMETRLQTLEGEVYRLSSALEERDKDNTRQHHGISGEMIIDAPSPIRQKGHFLTTTTTTTKSFAPTTTITSTQEGRTQDQQERGHKNGGNILSRHLEDNLERGDIASTLNDDYGEEILFGNSTEQYNDPLHS